MFYTNLIINGIIMNKITYAGFIFLLSASVYAHNENMAYVTNAASPGSISACTLHPHTGQFESCESLWLAHLSTPLDMAFATFDEITYAYITNSTYPAVVTQCQLLDKEFQDCILTDVPSYSGISFYARDALYAYLSLTDSVQKCKVATNGQLKKQDCADSGAGAIFFNGPMYINFQTFQDQTYAYIANGDYHVGASVMQCAVLENGDFNDCKDSGAGVYLNGAADVEFVTIFEQTYAYITESGGAVTKCAVDPQNGLLDTCAPTGGDFSTPIGMTIKKIADILYVYIVDGGFRAPIANQVLQCEVAPSGDLDCDDAGVGNIFNYPFGII